MDFYIVFYVVDTLGGSKQKRETQSNLINNRRTCGQINCLR